MIAVLKYGIGNIASILNMIKKAGGDAVHTSSLDEIANADKLVLPGMGSFDVGMSNLKEAGLLEILEDKVFKERVPILGICLGMQLMTKGSEEGKKKGLGWVDAQATKFIFDGSQQNLKIPHMGWNIVNVVNDGALFKEMHPKSRFYFAHSYYISCNNPKDVTTTTPYGVDFVSSFQVDNIMGTQFHPEKSVRYGLKLMKNFVEM